MLGFCNLSQSRQEINIQTNKDEKTLLVFTAGFGVAIQSRRIGFSKYIWGGRVNYQDVLKKIYDDVNKEYGTSVPVPE